MSGQTSEAGHCPSHAVVTGQNDRTSPTASPNRGFTTRVRNSRPGEGTALANDYPRPLPRSNTGTLIEPVSPPAYLLTLDGGGIRGYSSLLIIRELMTKIGECERRHNPDATHSHHPVSYRSPRGSKNEQCLPHNRYLPCHYFDFVAGTSTGGLIAIMLGRLRMSIDDCIREYETFSGDIFGHPRIFNIRGPFYWPQEKYRSRWLKGAINDIVERRHPSTQGTLRINLKSPPDLCKTMVFSVLRTKVVPERPYVFRSYDHKPRGDFHEQLARLNPGPAHEIALADVALATAAAPTYFKRHKIEKELFIDGGFGANNPTYYAFVEIEQLRRYTEYPVKLVLSVGTGKSRFISRFGDGRIGKYYQYLKFSKKMASDSERGDEEMRQRLQGQYENPQMYQHRMVTYRRFNVDEGLENMKLDEWKPSTLEHITTVTQRYIQNIQTQLEEVANRLVSNRIERSKLPSWERVSTGADWLCPSCGYDLAPFVLSDDLRSHMSERHGVSSSSSEMDQILESARVTP